MFRQIVISSDSRHRRQQQPPNYRSARRLHWHGKVPARFCADVTDDTVADARSTRLSSGLSTSAPAATAIVATSPGEYQVFWARSRLQLRAAARHAQAVAIASVAILLELIATVETVSHLLATLWTFLSRRQPRAGKLAMRNLLKSGCNGWLTSAPLGTMATIIEPLSDP